MTAEERAIEFVLRHEGGYVCDPDDPGGETKFGISKRSYPDVDIKRLTRDGAAEIYYRDFWLPIRGPALPESVAVPLMDFAVNAGIPRAVRALQAVVGITPTGEMTEATVRASREAIDRRGTVSIAEDLIEERARHLVHLACKRRGSDKFLVGWMKRIRDNLRFVRSG